MIEPMVRFPEFKDLWINHKIEDIFDRVGTPVDLDDTQTYREIGIRSHGKGIFHKEETTATEIGNKRVFWVEPDCFVVNIVFAWERAVAKTTEKENGMIASHRFPMYKPKKDIVDLDYITEYFITKRGQNVLILASPGGAGRNKTLGQKEFAKSVVKLPSLPEQQKIAEFLSTIDTVIEKQKETVSAWEERKKGVMQKLFSQEVRFKVDDGSEFPEWEEKKLGDVCEYRKGQSVGVNYVGTENMNQNFSGVDSLDSTNEVNGVIYCVGDTLMSNIRPYLKKTWKADRNGVCSTDVLVFRPVNIDSDFLYYNISSEKFVLYVMTGVKGSKMPRGDKGHIMEYNMPIPCLAEQQKIADCLSSLDEVIEKQKAILTAWKELKKGLLQQMFV